MVSGPTHVIRAGQISDGIEVGDLRGGQLHAADHLPDRTALVRRRVAVHRLGVGQRLRDGPVRVGRHDDDRQGAAGPREVRQAADAGLALGIGEGAFGGGGQDHGGDGHGTAMLPQPVGRRRAQRRYATLPAP